MYIMIKIGLILLLISLACAVPEKKKLITLGVNNTAIIKGPILSSTVSRTIEELFSIKDNNIYLYFNTPGGSVMDGNDIIDVIESLSLQGKNIVCIADVAVSMGFVIFQHCPHRYITPRAVLMQHQMSLGLEGSMEHLKSRMVFVQDLGNQLSTVQANRLNMTLNDFNNKVISDWWMYGNTILHNKAADDIAYVVCDFDPKMNNYTIQYKTFFGPVNVVYSKCPKYKEPLEITFKAKVDGNMTITHISNDEWLKMKRDSDKRMNKDENDPQTFIEKIDWIN